MQTLGEVCSQIVDCKNRTAPIDPAGAYFAVGTPAMRGNVINYAEARRISAETFAEWTKRLEPQKGDILFAREAPVGPLVEIPEGGRIAAGQRTMLLRANPTQANSAFLRLYLGSPQVQARILALASGSTTPHLRVTDVRNLPVELPDLSDQQAIAEVLGALDDKIATNTRLGELEERLLSAEYKRAIHADGGTDAALFDTLHVEFGEPFSGSAFSEPGTGRPLIRIRDLKTFRSQVWTTESRTREVVVHPGDVVVGMDAEFRPTTWLGDPGLLNQRVCRVLGKSFGEALTREALKAPLMKIENSKSATTVIHLNKRDLERVVLTIPRATHIAEFESRAEPLYRHRVSLALENRTLAATRDALLPQLMSGKLRVRDAEEVLSAAV